MLSGFARRRKCRLSMLLVAYNMPRELPRTLFSLSAAYQRDIEPEDYEVIVIDNGSSPPVSRDIFEPLQGRFRLFTFPDPSASPVDAINNASATAEGEIIGIMVDGARICSPGLLGWALRAFRAFDDPVVSTLNWHLGPKQQNDSIVEGYNESVEDEMLESAQWTQDGYVLHGLSSLGGSSLHGYFSPISESNAIFVSRKTFDRMEGYETRFQSPGGGLVNLDFYKRAVELETTTPVMLLGEGTFHQVHGGVMTNANPSRKKTNWKKFDAEYQAIRGEPFQQPLCRFAYIGEISPPALPVLCRSSRKALERAKTEAGPYFDQFYPLSKKSSD